MEYSRKRLYILRDVGYVHDGTWTTESGDYAVLKRSDGKGRYIEPRIHYVYYHKAYKGKLGDTIYPQNDDFVVISYVTLNNRRVVLDKHGGYKKYSKYL